MQVIYNFITYLNGFHGSIKGFDGWCVYICKLSKISEGTILYMHQYYYCVAINIAIILLDEYFARNFNCRCNG